MQNQSKIDAAKVIGAGVTSGGFVVADINGWLTLFSLVLSISYVIWKWRKDIKKNENP